jgi:hypothetical protein
MKNVKIFFLAVLILALSILTGCTLYKSTTETIAPATENVDEQQQLELKAKVIELEQRIKVLEEKLQGQW